jgi:hypothetical protein
MERETPAGSLREQVPKTLARFDDRWGITWRTYNIVNGINAKRFGKFVSELRRQSRFERPLFIIGVSRSGTTLVFRFLSSSPTIGALPKEGHDLWRAFHHPRYRQWTSDEVATGEVCFGERRFVSAYLKSYFDQQRFVEKTPENAFRVGYILDLFPDARFVVVRRDPLKVIRSLIAGWRDPNGRFRSYFVPEDLTIPDYPHRRRWCFALVEGWRDLRSASIPEIAFAQWTAYVESIERARKLVKQDRWLDIYLEDLLESPINTAAKLCEFSDVGFDRTLEREVHELVARPVYALSNSSPAGLDAGRDPEIRELLPRVQARAVQSGYEIENLGDSYAVSPSRIHLT